MQILEFFLYIVWLGSLVGIAFIAAPAAFAHAPAREAGAIIGASLRTLTWLTWLCGGLILIIWLGRIPVDGRMAILAALLVALAVGTTDYVQGSLAPRMDAIVAAVPDSIDALPPGDVRRRTFEALHRRSSNAYGLVLICGFVAAALSAARR
ncbi:MAG: DUF4149 domain-containing protein [bacterium]|nr:DUF4149 domain-containing protein [bacterium]